MTKHGMKYIRTLMGDWKRKTRIALSAVLIGFITFLAMPSAQISINIGNFLSIDGQVGLRAARAAATITSLGTNTDKNGTDPWTAFSSVTLATGDLLVVCMAFDSPGNGYVQWDGNTLDSDSGADNSGNCQVYINSYYCTSGGTGDIIAYWGINVPDAMAFTAYKISGLTSSPLDKTDNNTGSGTDATVTYTGALTQDDEVCIAVTAVEDEVDDGHGSWTTGAAYIDGNEQFDATDGQGDASNIQVHSVAEIFSTGTSLSTLTGDDTGHDSNDWAACLATYKVSTGATPDISNSPSSKDFGTVYPNGTYWANGSEPSWPLTDGDAYFTVTNNSGAAVDIDFKATNFTGGTTWTLVASSPGTNQVVLTVFIEGDGSGDGVYLTTSDQTLITSLADSANIDWELKLLMGSDIANETDQHSSTITLTAGLS